MKVLYDEDLANRVSPELCGGSGNIAAFWLVLLTGGGLRDRQERIHMKYRGRLRGFDLTMVEDMVRYSSERYIDLETQRLVVVGRHNVSWY